MARVLDRKAVLQFDQRLSATMKALDVTTHTTDQMTAIRNARMALDRVAVHMERNQIRKED